MPQLDSSTFLPQLFWLAVSFVVLYALMRWLALPRVRSAIDARRRQIDGDLSRAAELKAQAEAAQDAYQKVLAEARAAAQATLREAGERLAGEAAERQRQLAASLAEQIAAAEQRIADARQAALGEVRGIAADIARSVTEKLTGAAPDPAPVAAAVERVLADRTLDGGG
jgi:F-type H+-transporting ATPase subunit b